MVNTEGGDVLYLLLFLLENSLRRRKLEVMDVATDSHLEGAGESLEDAFDLVMLVVAFCLDVEIDARTVAERLEEVEEHLGWHIAYTFAMELSIPHQPRTATEVEGHLRAGF